MADASQTRAKWQEIANRGLQDRFDPQTRVKFDEAVRRGLITVPGGNSTARASGPPVIENSPPKTGIVPESMNIADPTPNSTPLQEIGGAGETALSIATGGALAPVAGISGIVSALRPGGMTGAERVQDVMSMGFQPKTETGREVASNVGEFFAPIGEATQGAGNIALDVTGSPAVATAVKTGIEAVPMLFGRRPSGSRTLNQRNVDINSVLEETSNLGLDVGAPRVRQQGQVIEAARDMSGQTQRGQNIGDLQEGLRSARAVQENYVNSLYGSAREANADISTSRGTDMFKVIQDSLADRNIRKRITPSTVASLKQLDEIMSGDLSSPVTVQRIMEYRMENNAIRNSKKPDNAALSIINNTVDSFLRAEVANGLIRGDTTAVAKWTEAFKGTKEFNEIFNSEKIIKDLTTRTDITPETAKQMILGLNSVNAKTQAGEIVRQIGGIVGKDSPEFGALRQEVIFDIVEPLLRAEPNFKGFAENYDKFVRNNMTLGKELYPDSMSEMLTLRRFVSSLERGQASGLDINLNQTVARILFGHEIAKGAVKVSLGSNLMNMVRAASGTSPKKLMISDFTGYDITKPLIPKAPVVIGGITQSGIGEQEQQDDMGTN